MSDAKGDPERLPPGYVYIYPGNVRPGDFVMWRKGRTWHRVTGVLDGDPPLIETAYRGTETRGLTLNVRFAIREHLAMPRWMEWMEPDE